MIRIGYQGEVGSNSEAVAKIFSTERDYGLDEFELVPLVESGRVVNALKTGDIDYGVVAVRNSEAGFVKETYEAMKGEHFDCIRTIEMLIHHCIFIKPSVDEEDITVVASHIQALDQTRKTRSKRFPKWTEEIVNDTAAAARNLSEGLFPDNYAVICRKNAGEAYGLRLLCENIEDSPDNRTEFAILMSCI